MKDNPSLFSACQTAAIRVQYWFGKDRPHLFSSWSSLLDSQRFLKVYQSGYVKVPRNLSQLMPIASSSLHGAWGEGRHVSQGPSQKDSQMVFDSLCCSVNQKYLYALRSERVIHWRLKEKFVVCKCLKEIAQQSRCGPKYHNVVPISAEPVSELVSLPWEKRKEERHFQIERVVKYLVW